MLFFCRLLIFFQNQRFVSVSKSLDPDQARHIVGPDLGINCLQRLSADGISRQRVNQLLDIASENIFFNYKKGYLNSLLAFLSSIEFLNVPFSKKHVVLQKYTKEWFSL